MTTVEKIKEKCNEMGVTISRLEKMCGFSNGYIGQLKRGELPADRLAKVAEFLDVPLEYFYGNINWEKTINEDAYIESIRYIKNHWDDYRFDFCYEIIWKLYLADHPEDKEKICSPNARNVDYKSQH